MASVVRKLEISRRTWLRGAAALIALPWLDCMHSALARPANRPKRIAFCYVPNGKDMEHWVPERTGALDILPCLLEPLEPVRDQLLVLSGLTLDAARSHGDGPGDHARASAAFLTCTHPFKTGGESLRVQTSVDQLIARHLGAETRLPSLELGCESAHGAGACDSGYSCAYSNHIAWRSAATPMAKEIDPRAAFERLFGAAEEGNDAERARRIAERRSVLDLALEDAHALERRLGAADRVRLDDYLSALREVEQRIERAMRPEPAPVASQGLRAMTGVPADYAEHVRVMYELIALAFAADVTRVATLMLANAGSNRSYPCAQVAEGHHDLSHHGNDVQKLVKLRQINRFHVTQFARFLARLKGTAEGDQTLLDRCHIVYGSGIADGNRHNHDDLPVLLAGRGGGTIAPGRHVRYAAETPLAALHLALLASMGVRARAFGDATAPLAGLDRELPAGG